jgi:hypothetical protein
MTVNQWIKCRLQKIHNDIKSETTVSNLESILYKNLYRQGHSKSNCIDDIMDSILASSVVDCGIEPHSVQTKLMV